MFFIELDLSSSEFGDPKFECHVVNHFIIVWVWPSRLDL